VCFESPKVSWGRYRISSQEGLRTQNSHPVELVVIHNAGFGGILGYVAFLLDVGGGSQLGFLAGSSFWDVKSCATVASPH
jgi:hypothetical protein